MKVSDELITKAKNCKSAEEISMLAKEHGVELSQKEAAEAFARLRKIGEISEEELSAVSGGVMDGCGASEEVTPAAFSIGERVLYGTWDGVITAMRYSTEFLRDGWYYTVECENGYVDDIAEFNLTKKIILNI